MSSWSDFLKLVLKALGPSLDVNRMWTKKDDHAPKCECAEFFLIHAPKGQFSKKLKKIQV
jgi:hypothetical protein